MAHAQGARRRVSKTTMRTRRKTTLWAISGVVAAALSATLLTISRRAGSGDDLLARAAPLVAAPVWRGNGRYLSSFYWLSDHEVLRFAKNGTGKTATQTPVIFDTATGKARAVPGAGRLMVNQRPLSVSPDGVWLLYLDKRGSPTRLLALALDGSGRHRQWKGAYVTGGVWWFRDKRRFVSVNYDWVRKVSLARVYALNDEQPGQPTRLPRFPSAPGSGYPGTGALFLVGQLPSGRFLGFGTETVSMSARSGGGSKPTNAAALIEFGLDKNNAPPRTVTVVAPAINNGSTASGGVVRTFSGALGTVGSRFSSRRAQLSPSGDRLLWTVDTFEFSSAYGSGSGALGRILPALYRVLPVRFRPRMSFRDSYDVFAARVDGRGGLVHIGAVASRETGSGSISSAITWTPDGKRIAFTYKGALYAVPVDAP